VSRRERPRRHEIELLEPRLYLSTIVEQAWWADWRDAGPAESSGSAVESADSILDAPEDVAAAPSVIDVNGAASSDDAVVATFDANTGELVEAVVAPRGAFVLSGNTLYFDTVGSADSATDLGLTRVDLVTGEIARLPLAPAVADHGGADRLAAVPSLDGTMGDGDATDQDWFPAHGTGDLAGLVPMETTSAGRIVAILVDVVVPESLTLFDLLQAQARPDGATRHYTSAMSSQPRSDAVPSPASLASDGGSSALSPGPTPAPSPPFPGWVSRPPWLDRALLLRGGSDDAATRDDRLGQSGGEVDFGLSHTVVLSERGRIIVFLRPTAARRVQSAGVLTVYDPTSGQLTNTGQLGLAPLGVADGQVGFLGVESLQQRDLNGDGDLHDQVLQWFDPGTGGVRATREAGESLRREHGRLLLVTRDGTTLQVRPTVPVAPTASTAATTAPPRAADLADVAALVRRHDRGPAKPQGDQTSPATPARSVAGSPQKQPSATSRGPESPANAPAAPAKEAAASQPTNGPASE
jgi:hypothetical protein